MNIFGVSKDRFLQLEAEGKLEGNPYYHIMKAVCDRFIDLLQITTSKDPWHILIPNTVVQIGDDTEVSLGPTAFHEQSLINGIQQCRVTLQIANFQQVVMTAILAGAIMSIPQMIVEATEETEIEWWKFIQAAGPRFGLLVCTSSQSKIH